MTTTFAVAFLAGSGVSSWFWTSVLATLLVAAAGSGMLSTLFKSATARRYLWAFALAVVLSLTLGASRAYAVVYGPCTDSIWYRWFWLC